MNKNNYRLAIFDLDGTLADTAPDVHYSMNIMRAEMGLPPISLAEAKKAIGPGPDLFVKHITSNHQTDIAKVVKQFRGIYSDHLAERTKLFPKIKETLEHLHNWQISMIVVTNKPVQYSKLILKKLTVDHYFLAIIGPEDVPRQKPAPDPIIKALQFANVQPHEALMIGDTEYDFHAARAANVNICAVGYGYTNAENLKEMKPDHFVASPGEIISLFRNGTLDQSSGKI